MRNLIISHGCFSGDVKVFRKWKDDLSRLRRNVRQPAETYARMWGNWDQTPPEPLDVILLHSEHGGVIFPDQAGDLSNRLEELENHIAIEFITLIRDFIEGLDRACMSGEIVVYFYDHGKKGA